MHNSMETFGISLPQDERVEWGIDANVYGVSFWGDENVLKLDG